MIHETQRLDNIVWCQKAEGLGSTLYEGLGSTL